MSFKITVLSWMKNEADMVPFFLRHYHFADEIIVWDNESEDDTRELLLKDPRVQVRDWITGGEMRDVELTEMKSMEYRKTGEGWKFVVDADEFVWHPDMRGFLSMCDGVGVTVPTTEGFDMISDFMPVDDGKSQLKDLVRTGVPCPLYCKACVLRHTALVRYGHGSHFMASGQGVTGTDRPYLKLLHYRYLSRQRVMRKAFEYKQSPENVAMQAGKENCDVNLMLFRYEERWKLKREVL